jgi:hypothetical protein
MPLLTAVWVLGRLYLIVLMVFLGALPQRHLNPRTPLCSDPIA